MSLTEFDQEEYDRNRREEGIEIGEARIKLSTAKKMKADNLPIETIMKYTKLSKEEILAL